MYVNTITTDYLALDTVYFDNIEIPKSSILCRVDKCMLLRYFKQDSMVALF